MVGKDTHQTIPLELLVESLFAISDELVFLVDGEGRYVKFGESGLRNFGFELKDVQGKTPEEAFGPTLGARFSRNNLEVIKHRRTVQLQEWMEIGGQMRCIATALIPVEDVPGHVMGVLGLCRDITEQKRLLEEREFYHKQLELVCKQRKSFDNLMRDVVRETVARRGVDLIQAVVDAMGRELHVSRVYLYWYNTARESVSSVAEWTAEGVPSLLSKRQDYPISEQPWWKSEMFAGKSICIQNVEDVPYPELKAVLDEGGTKAILAIPIFIFGKPFGFIGLDDCEGPRRWEPAEIEILLNIAHVIAQKIERQRLEDDILRSERLAAIGRLTASFTHEINNPLQSILLNLEMLEDHVDEKALRNFVRVREGFRQVSGIVSRLSQANRSTGVASIVHINEVIAKTFKLIAHLFDQKGINILWKLDHAHTPVWGDSEKLQQVFLNVLLNAYDALERGGELTIMTKANEHGVTVEIQDTGIGVDADLLPYIFDPFFTTKESTSGGIGLGLYVAHRIVTDHCGKIRVSSEKGRGSIVTIELPSKKESNG